MRFCSRCGLALSGLAEWLAGGRLPLVRQQEEQANTLSPRRKGIRRAAKLMFFSAVLFPIFLAMSIGVEDGGPMAVPFIVFFISLVMMLYARLFSDKHAPPPQIRPAETSVLGQPQTRGALPPPINVPVPGVGRPPVRTNEIAQPPSVTDHTTRLLDND
ncbi:MAG TPA: hypothetical protein VFM63_10340 [Pyrinomonadaceae bacterium]|nr:hypothetical protein [Pyrinomonadaceae bacterium]